MRHDFNSPCGNEGNGWRCYKMRHDFNSSCGKKAQQVALLSNASRLILDKHKASSLSSGPPLQMILDKEPEPPLALGPGALYK